MSAVQGTSTTSAELAASKWGAFGHAAFAVIWIASIVSYVGTAMFDTASGWLMTSLSADPLAVSLVQVAVSLPLFLFTLPAGALADVIDSRRLLILVESLIVVVSAVFAGLVSFGLAMTGALLVATFLLGIGGALSSPAWRPSRRGARGPSLRGEQSIRGRDIDSNGGVLPFRKRVLGAPQPDEPGTPILWRVDGSHRRWSRRRLVRSEPAESDNGTRSRRCVGDARHGPRACPLRARA